MKDSLNAYLQTKKDDVAAKLDDISMAERQIDELLNLTAQVIGPDKMVLKATKLGAVRYLRSKELSERALALKRLVLEDPTAKLTVGDLDWVRFVEDMEEKVAEIIAKKSLEEQLEQRITQKMQEKHEDYINEIKMQVIKQYNPNPENAHTLKRLAILEKMNASGLARSVMEVLRPQKLEEIIGQERGIKSLLAKMSSPYPHHFLIYGPPGVGKTSAARLVLQTVKEIAHSPFKKEAPFIEVDGATLRWDPRDVTNPLIGSVHDPIYQGARKDFAETGIPEPKLGLVTDAQGGILFIDEIGEMDAVLQNKLLKVLEDKRVSFESAYYDPSDPNIPLYIKKLFDEGAPADFVLIGATTRDPSEINPAIRSRCAEVYFEPLTPGDIEIIIKNAAQKLGVSLEEGIPRLISEYTIEGRKANSLLADAYGLALYRRGRRELDGEKLLVTQEDVYEVIQVARLAPFVTAKGSENPEVGRIFGLGVAGFLGSVLEFEAVAFPAKKHGEGQIRFNETAGSMAKDSVFNASSVMRMLTGEDLMQYDLHVNVVGGGKIDGPSAGMAVCLAIYSAVTGKALRQDTAVTGEISIQGRIKAVGGIFEKIYGAKQAGMKKILIPQENHADVPGDLTGIEVVLVKTINEALEHILAESAGCGQGAL